MSSFVHTFLFMDLVGFTVLTAERGDDDAAEVAHRFYAQVRALLAEHDAEEIKTIGDAMMLRCDDPRVGIDIGVGIVARMRGSAGLPPVRVGVHTGTAVCRGDDWYGSAVNVAARLCSAAGGGEVLVSEDARAGAGSLAGLELSDRQLHWLKNVPQPVVAFQASAAVAPQQERAWMRLRQRPQLAPRSLRCSEQRGLPA